MFGLKGFRHRILTDADQRASEVAARYHEYAKDATTLLVKSIQVEHREQTKRLDKEIADLKAVVQELRESHNDLFKYDVSKRFMVSGLYTGRVMFFDMARSLFGQPSSHKPEPDATPYVARLAKTDPQAEPIPVKPARKR